ncbi:MAG: CHASE domain-containing protein [Candidatus Nomurabacteria bacterium]
MLIEKNGKHVSSKSLSVLSTLNSLKTYIILFVGFAVTITISVYSYQNIETISTQELRSIGTELKIKIDDRLHANAMLLRSGAAFFSSHDAITREQWKTFIKKLSIEKNLPGIQGVGFSLIIPKEELQRHITNVRKEGFRDYDVKPVGASDVYTSIIFLEPFSGINLKAFGYDMFSDPTRRKAMEQARDSDNVSLSGKVNLIQDAGERVQASTLMYVPVYRNDMPTNSVIQRRAAIIGWVFSPYHMQDIMRGILGRWDHKIEDRIRIRIYDDKITDESILYDSQAIDSLRNYTSATHHISLSIDINGKKWVILLEQKNVLFSFKQSETFIILLSGFLLSLALFFLLVSLTNTKQKAENLAKALTVELSELNKYLQAIRSKERNDFAKEVHDKIGQQLIALRYELDRLKSKVKSDDSAFFQKLENLSAEVVEMIQNFKILYYSVNPSLLDDFSLSDSIGFLINSFRDENSVIVNYFTDTESLLLNPEIKLAIYKVSEECLKNVKLHSKATSVFVSLIESKGSLIFEIEDNGCGFELSEIDIARHHGILEIRERVSSIMGNLIIKSIPGKGSRIRINVKLK